MTYKTTQPMLMFVFTVMFTFLLLWNGSVFALPLGQTGPIQFGDATLGNICLSQAVSLSRSDNG